MKEEFPGPGYTIKIRCAGHLSQALKPEDVRDLVPRIVKILKRHDFDAIAFQGLSGSLIAPIVAYEMGKTLLAVRKHLNCHSVLTVEGDYAARRYVVLDDFVSSGTTVRKIFTEIRDAMPESRCIGVLSYRYLPYNEDGDVIPVGDDGTAPPWWLTARPIWRREGE